MKQLGYVANESMFRVILKRSFSRAGIVGDELINSVIIKAKNRNISQTIMYHVIDFFMVNLTSFSCRLLSKI